MSHSSIISADVSRGYFQNIASDYTWSKNCVEVENKQFQLFKIDSFPYFNFYLVITNRLTIYVNVIFRVLINDLGVNSDCRFLCVTFCSFYGIFGNRLWSKLLFYNFYGFFSAFCSRIFGLWQAPMNRFSVAEITTVGALSASQQQEMWSVESGSDLFRRI